MPVPLKDVGHKKFTDISQCLLVLFGKLVAIFSNSKQKFLSIFYKNFNFFCVAHLSAIKFWILVTALVANPLFLVDINFIKFLLKLV